jgi:hypothetical protein
LTADGVGGTLKVNNNPSAASVSDSEGTTLDGTGVTTTGGGQTYNDAVTLGANTTLNDNNNGNITFVSTVDADAAANNRTLTVNTGGQTIFDGAVGALGTTPATSTALASLTTDAAGTTKINGGAVYAGIQDYNDPVILGASATLAGDDVNAVGNHLDAATSVTFGNTVDGTTANLQGLTVDAKTATFDNKAGNTTALASLTTEDLSGGVAGTGATDINGAAVYAGVQSYDDAVTLGANTTLAANNADGYATSVTFESTLDSDAVSARNLTIYVDPGTVGFDGNVTAFSILASDGNVTFGGDIGDNHPLGALSIQTSGGGVGDFVDLQGHTYTTTGGGQSYGPVILTGNAIVSDTQDGNIVFNSTVDADAAANNRTLTVNTGGQTIFDGAVGALGTTPATSTALAGLTTDASGTTTLNGGAVYASIQDYNDPVVLGASTTLALDDLNAAGNHLDAATSVTFGGTVDATVAGGQTLLVDAKTATFDGVVGGVGTTLATSTALGSVTTEDISGATPGTGATDINGTAVYAGTQSYSDAVTLGATATLAGDDLNTAHNQPLDAATSVTFAGTVDGTTANTQGLTVDAATATFGNKVGNTTALASLTTEDLSGGVAGTGATDINGGVVTTSGAQTYNDPVTLGANTVLTAVNTITPASGTIVEAAGVTGAAFTLTLDNSGTVTGPGIVTVGTLALDGSGNVGAPGGLNNANALITDVPIITLNETQAAANGYWINNQTYAVNLSGTTQDGVTLDGTGILTVNSTLSAASFADNMTGGTMLDAATVTTSGDQNYVTSPITLGAGTTTLSSGTVELAAVNGGGSLNVSGTATLSGAVGSSGQLASLTLNNAANLDGGAINTTGSQSYNGAVALGADATLTGASVALNSTVNGAYALTVDGQATLGGAVGGGTELISLTLADAASLNGGSVKTTGEQDYKGAVTLGANTTLNGSPVVFGSTVNGAHTLAVTGSATFGGAVGGVASLTSLTMNNAANLNGVSISTTGAQTYDGAVTLGASDTLTSTGGKNITFVSAVNGDFGLTVNTSGNEDFEGGVGTSQALANLTTDGSGTVGGTAMFNIGLANSDGNAVVVNGEITLNDNLESYAASGSTILGEMKAGSVATPGNGEVIIDSSKLVVYSTDQSYVTRTFTTSNPLDEEPSATVITGSGSIADVGGDIKGIYNNQVKKFVPADQVKVVPGPAVILPPGQYLTRSGDVPQ